MRFKSESATGVHQMLVPCCAPKEKPHAEQGCYFLLKNKSFKFLTCCGDYRPILWNSEPHMVTRCSHLALLEVCFSCQELQHLFANIKIKQERGGKGRLAVCSEITLVLAWMAKPPLGNCCTRAVQVLHSKGGHDEVIMTHLRFPKSNSLDLLYSKQWVSLWTILVKR